MLKIVLVVLVGLGAFCTSLLWYSPLLFGNVWHSGADASLATSATWKFFAAPVREIVTAFTVLYLMRRVSPMTWTSVWTLAAVLWVGFYVVQLSGAVIWDGRPLTLSAVHGGDWLLKLLVISSGVYLIHRSEFASTNC